MVKRKLLLLSLLMAACQPATPPPPITAVMGEEFTLAPGQSVAIADANLILTLVSVLDDGRCPLEIECAESGPVAVTATVQSGSNAPNEIVFQTFTDNDGRVPEMEFQGMTDRVEFEGYLIQVESILPFPQMSVSEIGDSEYRVSFLITK